MANPNFVTEHSTYEIWRADDTTRCLDDDLVAIEESLENKASSDHTHSGYAASNHTHNEYAASNHTHSGYATSDHTHSGYAANNHTHTEYAASNHSHSEYAEADHTHTGFASSDHSHSPASIGAAPASHSHDYAASNHGHSYNDLSDKPTIPSAYTHPANHPASMITGLAEVATTGSYDDLTDKPTIPAAYSHPANHPASMITGLAEVATTGDYNDLSNKPTIPTIPSSLPANGGNADTVDGKHASDFATANHTHAMQESEVGIVTTGTGSAYVASVDGIDALTVGASFIMVPHVVSAASAPTLNVNGLGAKAIRRLISGSTATTVATGNANTWLAANKPIRMTYNGAYWIADMDKPNVNDLYGTVPVTKGGTGATDAATALTNLGAFPAAGGTINGDVNVAGVLRDNGQQAFFFATSTMSQTIGTNNATGGTNIACGPDATCNIGGAIQKVETVLPRSTNSYNCGNANFRWKGIYSNAAVNVSSDERLKRDITPMDNADLAKFVEGLNVVSYNYNDDEADRKARIGLIAQQVQKVDAKMASFFVNVDEDGMLSMTPADLVFALIAAVQELKKEVEALKK